MFARLKEQPAFPFVAPFVLYMLCLMLEGIHPSSVYVVYPIKAVAVGVLILCLLIRLPSFNLNRPWLSVGIGVAVFLLWVGLGPHMTLGKIVQSLGLEPFVYSLNKLTQNLGLGALIPVGEMGEGFNPFLFKDKQIAWGLVGFRIFGAAFVVPVMEELFWRGFLMRYLIKEKFEEVELGTYTHLSFAVTTLFFALVHGPLAPVALLTGLLYGVLFIRSKSLGNVMLAHGMTNFLLGAYVLYTGKWTFW